VKGTSYETRILPGSSPRLCDDPARPDDPMLSAADARRHRAEPPSAPAKIV